MKIPVPTSGVRVEVNTEEDWTRNVITAPMAMAIYLIRSQKTFFEETLVYKKLHEGKRKKKKKKIQLNLHSYIVNGPV